MKLENYVDQLLNQFYFNLKKAIENMDVIAIHDLRVALKRLFVLNKVMDKHYPDLARLYKKSLKKIHCIFKQAGVIRDNQMSNKLAKKWLSEENYIKFRDFNLKITDNAKEKLDSLYADFDIEKMHDEFYCSFYRVSSHYMAEFRDYLLVYIEGNGKKIMKSRQSSKCDFHAIRRWVKEQYYIQIQLKEVMGVEVNKEILCNKNQVGKLLGEWHDLKVFEKQLKKSSCEMDELLHDDMNRLEQSLIKDTGMI